MGTTSSSSMADRDGARHRPVAVAEELIPQHAADHQLIGAAEQRAESRTRRRPGMNTSIEPAMMPGIDNGSVIVQEGLERLGAEIRRRLEQREVVLLQVRVQRQDHERQVGVDDADIHGEIRCIITIGSSMMPSAISTLLITPLLLRSRSRHTRAAETRSRTAG